MQEKKLHFHSLNVVISFSCLQFVNIATWLNKPYAIYVINTERFYAQRHFLFALKSHFLTHYISRNLLWLAICAHHISGNNNYKFGEKMLHEKYDLGILHH